MATTVNNWDNIAKSHKALKAKWVISDPKPKRLYRAWFYEMCVKRFEVSHLDQEMCWRWADLAYDCAEFHRNPWYEETRAIFTDRKVGDWVNSLSYHDIAMMEERPEWLMPAQRIEF